MHLALTTQFTFFNLLANAQLKPYTREKEYQSTLGKTKIITKSTALTWEITY